ncbi:MAG: YidC/Oxa1 family membrane protein insertase, partial [Clostridiales bacterium]|nr:YidC/Oxa1 family membrane protein insertase [Clostridiales bacterium]
MQTIITAIGTVLGAIMRVCYQVVNNYGLAIVLFTLVSKVILLPVSVWVHKNGLKVVRMQPEINRLNIKHFGDKDAIAEGQAALYKREKYNPLASLVPLAIQIVILMGVIEVIYHPLNYLLRMDAECIGAWLAAGQKLGGIDPAASQAQLKLLNLVHSGQGAALAGQVPQAWQSAQSALEGFGTRFLGIDLTWIASEKGAAFLLIPIVTGLSALLLSLVQNKLNPLQHEQNAGMQWGTSLFTVGISLYLGYFVPAGVALYWICSNLFTILQQLLLNRLIDPKKVVDYKALEETRAELDKLKNLGGSGDAKADKQLRRREKADYKRFFSVANKHLVFYSESNGFYKYFGPVLDEIFAR